ncbi:MAG: transposase [Halomonas sp.]|nr:transposase [Halomonas sp.]
MIEAEIRGKPPDERRQIRQTRLCPLLDELERWLRVALDTLSRKSDTAAVSCTRSSSGQHSCTLWRRCYRDGKLSGRTRFARDGRWAKHSEAVL